MYVYVCIHASTYSRSTRDVDVDVDVKGQSRALPPQSCGVISAPGLQVGPKVDGCVSSSPEGLGPNDMT